jgi:hypothetical protein
LAPLVHSLTRRAARGRGEGKGPCAAGWANARDCEPGGGNRAHARAGAPGAEVGGRRKEGPPTHPPPLSPAPSLTACDVLVADVTGAAVVTRGTGGARGAWAGGEGRARYRGMGSWGAGDERGGAYGARTAARVSGLAPTRRPPISSLPLPPPPTRVAGDAGAGEELAAALGGGPCSAGAAVGVAGVGVAGVWGQQQGGMEREALAVAAQGMMRGRVQPFHQSHVYDQRTNTVKLSQPLLNPRLGLTVCARRRAVAHDHPPVGRQGLGAAEPLSAGVAAGAARPGLSGLPALGALEDHFDVQLDLAAVLVQQLSAAATDLGLGRGNGGGGVPQPLRPESAVSPVPPALSRCRPLPRPLPTLWHSTSTWTEDGITPGCPCSQTV